MTDSADDIKKLEFLVEKSRALLREQLVSYENCTSKSGIIITVIALFIPLAVTFISSQDPYFILKLATILPIGLAVMALHKLLSVMKPKSLGHGFNFQQFSKNLRSDYSKLLSYEIETNRGTFNLNAPKVKKQIDDFKEGISYIVFSSSLLFLILIINLFFHH
ncbi:hypothetical protein [Albibacterium bauzanense]|uniref:SMODS and SLOG-associating 2TM effector domain-containing protein n=1 Tax=Albibacterium bauzanense TaxID=653929 RepID=A0A4R1M7R1_9SPHI|nr:hypothetical protein [Albibacterium bauzanense]TCK85733.1 hypothetical protein C8N28_1045 [Albibacterium bauzanense]